MRVLDQFIGELSEKGEDALALVRETAELVAYYRRLLERLERDALTGLPGNNKFCSFIENTEGIAESIGIIFFDVNGLKEYNDVKGHQAGDLLIQKAAESIIMACGENVRAFRVGGDEFVAVLPNCAECDIDAFLSRWREILDGLNAGEDGIHCAVAAGAAFGERGYRMSDVLQLADRRMYIEKRRMKAAGPLLPDCPPKKHD